MSASTLNLEAAERFYRKHLKHVSEYQKRNVEKMRVKNRDFNQKLKESDLERYERYLAKKREYYYTVRKPMLEAQKKAKKVKKEETQAINVNSTQTK
jgi:hypothetical protein